VISLCKNITVSMSFHSLSPYDNGRHINGIKYFGKMKECKPEVCKENGKDEWNGRWM
jgi:hypothetical protein